MDKGTWEKLNKARITPLNCVPAKYVAYFVNFMYALDVIIEHYLRESITNRIYKKGINSLKRIVTIISYNKFEKNLPNISKSVEQLTQTRS